MSIELSQYTGGLTAQLQESASNTSITEAQAGLAANGTSPAPEGSVAVVVEPGDTVSEIMAKYGLDYSNPADLETFYRLNPQFRPGSAEGRDENLIYIEEVIYMPDPDAAPPVDGPVDQSSTRTEPQTQAEAAQATDQAIADLEQAENADYPPGLEHEQNAAVSQARTDAYEAVETEIETGLDEFMAAHPDATPEEITAEADRLRHQIQGRSTTAAGLDDTSMEYHTQQAVNSASADQHGVDLDTVAPGTQINDGPYTETSGPFQPNSRVELRDGTYIQTDENGYPDTDTDNNGVADPVTSAQAGSNTDAAAQDLEAAQNMNVRPDLQHEKDAAIAEATNQLGNAVQQEVEVGLREFIAANPDATREEIEAHADQLMHAILGREGNGVITEAQAQARSEMAVENVIGSED